MSDWTADDLDRIGAAEEIDIAPQRGDGSSGPYVTIWVVRVGDELYVRSYRGRQGHWFRDAAASGAGSIRVADAEREVLIEEPRDADHGSIDRAYLDKYAGHEQSSVDAMVAPAAVQTTLRLTPA
jgi:hypothetical protein